jgi:hypothetical protein
MNKRILVLLSCLAAALLAGCGGGGGGSGGPIASANAFNVLAAYQSLAASGESTNLNVSGTCAGTASFARGPANTAATFESVSGFSATETIVVNLSNCTPSSSSDTTTQYYDVNYMPLGFSMSDDYGVWAAPPVIPASVHVGDSGALGTIEEFTDSSKSTTTGREQVSYVIEADTAATAIVNLIYKDYDASNVLQSTEQDRYRMSASGTLSLISVDLQFADGRHLVLK